MKSEHMQTDVVESLLIIQKTRSPNTINCNDRTNFPVLCVLFATILSI